MKSNQSAERKNVNSNVKKKDVLNKTVESNRVISSKVIGKINFRVKSVQVLGGKKRKKKEKKAKRSPLRGRDAQIPLQFFTATCVAWK